MTVATVKDPVREFAAQLREVGYITADDNLVTTLYGAVAAMGKKKGISALGLDGAPGTGKSFAAECLAKILDAKLLRLQFTVGIGREHLMDDLNLSAIVTAQANHESLSPEGVWLDGVLVRAIKLSQTQKVILLLDELDKAKPSTDAFLLEFLQLGGIALPNRGDEPLMANTGNLLVMLTKNNNRELSEPLMRRIRPIILSWPKHDLEAVLLLKETRRFAREHGLGGCWKQGAPEGMCKALATYAGRIREHEAHLKKVPSTPELVDCLCEIMLLDGPKARRGFIVWRTLFKYLDDYHTLQNDVKVKNPRGQEVPAFHEKVEDLAAVFAAF